jgi:hypothetical protein
MTGQKVVSRDQTFESLTQTVKVSQRTAGKTITGYLNYYNGFIFRDAASDFQGVILLSIF